VVITGTGFTDLIGVRFNGFNDTIASNFVVNSPAQITATVPAGATTGTILVITAGGAAASPASFIVIPTLAITSFSPVNGPIGTSVTINGTNFTGATTVAFNGIPVTGFKLISDNQITTKVPNGALTGTITVTTPDDTATSPTAFLVTPKIKSFTPASGAVGTVVTINGTTFSGAISVQFNGVPARKFKVKSNTVIIATVPVGATTGPIKVTTTSGSGNSTATSATSYTVTP
jgi:hypothetical protein